VSSRKIAQALLVCGWVLLPMTARGDTLSGVFATKDKTAAAGTNEACLVADGEFFSTFGIVTGTSNGCTAVISYETDSLNLVSLSPIKSGKSEGSARMTDTNFARVRVALFGAGCSIPYNGNASPNKCKVTSSWKGTTQSSGPDTFTGGKVALSCRLGEGGSELLPVPTPAQVDAFVAAFAGRSDVAFGDKEGAVKITQTSVSGGNACGN